MSSSSDYIAVPADVGARTARVWVGSAARDSVDPANVWLEHAPSGARWPVGQWATWQVPGDAAGSLKYNRIALSGLQPDTRYPLTLRVGGQVRATAEVTTLPVALPPLGAPPFTVLLGSCFCRQQDESGRVGRAFAQLPDGAKPRVKFLVGDQVYLDSPWYRFVRPHSERGLGSGFLAHYLQTWGQHGDAQGFNHLLRTGANYFCADDHEFWNNAPFPCTFAVNTWTEPGRKAWRSMALALYRAFQADIPGRIDVGSFSIRVLDTRVNRAPERSTFVTAQEMQSLADWVSALTGPGMLVVGQPIFATRAGIKGHVADWNLPDFAQYAELCRVLLSSKQSLLVVTGDVHYGRVATVQLPSGGELVELISSPMALVDRSAGGSWHAAPDRFPAEPIPGIKSLPVTTDVTWKRFSNHFVTIELNDLAGGLSVRVRAWETEPAGGIGAGVLVASRVLKKVA